MVLPRLHGTFITIESNDNDEDTTSLNNNNQLEIDEGHSEKSTTCTATTSMTTPTPKIIQNSHDLPPPPPPPLSPTDTANKHPIPKRFSSLPSSLNNFISESKQTKKQDPPARERPLDDKWPERDSLSFTRSLVFYGTGSITEEHVNACKCIMEARSMRKKYNGSRGTIIESQLKNNTTGSVSDKIMGFQFNNDGIVEVGFVPVLCGAEGSDIKVIEENLITVPSIDEFIQDYRRLEVICTDGAMRSFW